MIETKIKEHLDFITHQVREGIGYDHILSIILLGGYGRGEGGVVRENHTEQVFNDYDLYIIVKDYIPITKHFRTLIQQIASHCSQAVGIEVDLFALKLSTYKKLPIGLMNYEAKYGSRIIFGAPELIQEMPDYNLSEIPLVEGTRLLLNRGALLIYCRALLFKKISLTKEEHRICIKYLFKAQLAMGDTLLLHHGLYSIPYIEKRQTIQSISQSYYPRFNELKACYLEAIHFKFDIDFSLYEDKSLQEWFGSLSELFLDYYVWFEAQRLSLPFSNINEYLNTILIHAQHQPLHKQLRNILINLRSFGCPRFYQFRWLIAYPREKLYALFPYLISNTWIEAIPVMKKLMGVKSSSYQELFDRFWLIWKRFS